MFYPDQITTCDTGLVGHLSVRFIQVGCVYLNQERYVNLPLNHAEVLFTGSCGVKMYFVCAFAFCTQPTYNGFPVCVTHLPSRNSGGKQGYIYIYIYIYICVCVCACVCVCVCVCVLMCGSVAFSIFRFMHIDLFMCKFVELWVLRDAQVFCVSATIYTYTKTHAYTRTHITHTHQC